MDKLCPRCGVTKPASEYHQFPKSADGLQGYCRDCMNAYGRERYRASDRAAQQRAYRLVSEPDETIVPLTPGLRFARTEIDAMLRFGSFYPGTVLENSKGALYTVVWSDYKRADYPEQKLKRMS